MLRRDLLRLFASAPALPLGCRGSTPTQVPGPTERVVVVGAGMAGVCVAALLGAAGIKVIVVEARDRVGGRIHTVELGGATVDLGAAWIHGRKGNPVAGLVDGYGLATREHRYHPVRTWDAIEGREVREAELKAALAQEGRFRATLKSLREQLGEPASMQAAIDAHLARLGLDPRAARHARLVLEQYMLEVDYGGPTTRTSLALFDEDEFFGDDDHLIAGGYGALIARLVQGLDIRLNTPVARAGVDANHAWIVTTGDERIEADRVVMTVPLGVLRAGAITFEPALPAAKLAAIARMEPSSLEKVVLRFERVFWPIGANSAWLHIGRERGEFPLIIDFTADAGAPTLVLLHGGSRVREVLDICDDATLVEDARAVLAAVLGQEIPRPIASAVTRWRSDPFSLGSYSFPSLGQSMADFDALAAPVASRLLFAGEATSRTYFGTVHGAVDSARREAARLGVDSSGLPGL